MCEIGFEAGASMGSLQHTPPHGARATATRLSGIITSGPTTSDPLNVDFTGMTLLAIWAHPDDEAYLAGSDAIRCRRARGRAAVTQTNRIAQAAS
jgi:hypothetical protein